jgi:hypothetical protein
MAQAFVSSGIVTLGTNGAPVHPLWLRSWMAMRGGIALRPPKNAHHP